MRAASVANIKGARGTKQVLPRDGTRLREMYDRLKDAPGELVTFRSDRNFAGSIRQLRDFYSLDILRFGAFSCRLIGEWIGRDYVDYQREHDKTE